MEIAKIELIGPYYFVGPYMASAILLNAVTVIKKEQENLRIFNFLYIIYIILIIIYIIILCIQCSVQIHANYLKGLIVNLTMR